MKDSPYVRNTQKKDGKVTRVAEIQLIEGANSSVDEVTRQIKEALGPTKNTNVDRVKVYSEGELLVDLRVFQNRCFPKDYGWRR